MLSPSSRREMWKLKVLSLLKLHWRYEILIVSYIQTWIFESLCAWVLLSDKQNQKKTLSESRMSSISRD